MSFMTLIMKNLVRQRMRTALTALGIAIGITTVIALGVIVDGLLSAAGQILTTAGSDFMVGQKGSADLTFSTVSEDEVDAIAARPDVERAVGALITISRVGGNPYFVAIGIDPIDLQTVPLGIVAGQRFAPGATDEIMLGDAAAKELELTVGDRLSIQEVPFRVVGIYRTGNIWQDGGAYAPLQTLQETNGRIGVVTAVFVTVAEGADESVVAAGIEADLPTLVAIQDTSEYGEVDQGTELISAANLAISLLAVGIGAIGVMNTMIMSIFERTREIGVLRAIGWSGGRILRMIIGESLMLCVIAAAAGALLGVLLSQAVTLTSVKNLIQPEYNLQVFVRAFVVAVVVALAGAAYPAFRALRLTPMEALRHE